MPRRGPPATFGSSLMSRSRFAPFLLVALLAAGCGGDSADPSTTAAVAPGAGTDVLRSGSYAKTLTFTLSTTQP